MIEAKLAAAEKALEAERLLHQLWKMNPASFDPWEALAAHDESRKAMTEASTPSGRRCSPLSTCSSTRWCISAKRWRISAKGAAVMPEIPLDPAIGARLGALVAEAIEVQLAGVAPPARQLAKFLSLEPEMR